MRELLMDLPIWLAYGFATLVILRVLSAISSDPSYKNWRQTRAQLIATVLLGPISLILLGIAAWLLIILALADSTRQLGFWAGSQIRQHYIRHMVSQGFMDASTASTALPTRASPDTRISSTSSASSINNVSEQEPTA